MLIILVGSRYGGVEANRTMPFRKQYPTALHMNFYKPDPDRDRFRRLLKHLADSTYVVKHDGQKLTAYDEFLLEVPGSQVADILEYVAPARALSLPLRVVFFDYTGSPLDRANIMHAWPESWPAPEFVQVD